LNTHLIAAGSIDQVFQNHLLQNTFSGQPSVLSKLADIIEQEAFPVREKDFTDKK
jgi:hypothetical protein